MARIRKAAAADLSLTQVATDFRFALAAGGRRQTTVGWYADILDAFVQFATGELGRGPRLADLTVAPDPTRGSRPGRRRG